MGLTTDLDLSAASVASLTSGDGVAAFFTSLGYRTGVRTPLSAEAIGLAGDAAAPIREIELIAEDDDGFMRAVLVHLKSLTAKCRTDLARVLGRTNVDHLLVLTSDFATFEFVLLDKRRRDARGPIGGQRIQVVPLVFAVDRKGVASKELRTLRQFTWTTRDGLEQFDKLRRVFEAAAFTEDYFCNRALFADHYLTTRLREDPAWRESPAEPFQKVKDLLRDARANWYDKGEQIVRDELYEPLFKVLGLKAKRNKQADDDQTKPDYLLADSSGRTISAAFTYPWDRWLDGPDHQLDRDTPDENPGACVVTALEEGVADWIIVTNGRQWRLYSRHAHSRATNFYEIDLPETLLASGDTDPNEAFRYWWLFFRGQAFQPTGETPPKCWLDHIATESREYAKELGERLKGRIFEQIFPHLARGFLEDRRQRLGIRKAPSDDELRDVFQGTLTLLYRLLFLLYAESRDLLPVREAPYHAASLKRIKQEIADKAGIAQSDVEEQITKAFSTKETMLYDRLQRLFAAMDLGDAALNVPTYNGGLFITRPDRLEAADSTQERELRIARFLAEHKVPDRALALAIDFLSRDEDPKTFSLVFIDYKSLAVRHLGSIYEGLLEFKLQLAEEDLTTQTEKGKETFIPLGDAKKKRGKSPKVVVHKGEVYLSNDKAERKASGSYYTPDPIVTYIVAQTVGPVLAEKLEGLRKEFRKVRKTFDNEVQKATAFPVRKPDGTTWDAREFALEKVYVTHKDLVERLFDFRALDPAMGSGHFLVETVDFITDRILTFLNQFPINPVQVMLNRTRTNLLAALTDQGVTVDPAKLTDVNLLKRHVLKRCIYGVDLNPMAVELAKVSLWLDAFTLGAPLSFLNHHLRCGNSLIGATFADLQKALAGQLFGVDYEPLLRAIGHVLFVNKMADATAAEVKRSADEYEQARRDLSGYQIVLDLLVARHFGYPDAPDVLTHIGNELDLSSRARFEESLLITDRLLIQKVAEVARQPELRFFHWEIEFPEVFYGFADTNERRLVHKDEISPGSAGFDAVVGNPPYVRMELIKPLKPFLRTHYDCHAERADLFIYFYEQAMRLLRLHGRTAFIASSTWTKTNAGESLREFLKTNHTLVSFLDFGDLPVFEDATTYPCILVAERGKAESDHDVRAVVVRDVDDTDYHRLMTSGVHVNQASLDPAGWRFEDERLTRLFEKLREQGVPLKEYCGSPLYGIKTGLNDAFVVSNETRDRLVAEDPRSQEVLKPFLEGKDLKRWRQDWRGLWLIYTYHGIDIKKYPAILAYLKTFKPRLEARATSAHHKWYELQQPQQKFVPMMEATKIMYPDITVEPRFVMDGKGFYVSNTTYFLPGGDRYLQAILNSQLIWWFLSQSVRLMRGGYLRLFTQYIEIIPVVNALPNDKVMIGGIAESLSTPGVKDVLSLEQELQDRVATLYGLTAEERKIVAGLMPATPMSIPEDGDE